MTPEDVLARFVGVPWFENSGKHLDSRSPVKAWAEAADSCSDDHWTLITEASAASMTGDLSVMCPRRFGTWNETVAWVKLNILEEHVEPQIRKRELAGEFSAAVADCAGGMHFMLRWNCCTPIAVRLVSFANYWRCMNRGTFRVVGVATGLLGK